VSFFNRIVGLFSKKPQPIKAVAPPRAEPTLRERVEDMVRRSAPRGKLSATHRTSHRTVSMDLRDARRRRNIEKRKGR